MKFTVLILSIFLTTCLASEAGLHPDISCYSCFYHEGHPQSRLGCFNNTKSLTPKPCGEIVIVPGLQLVHHAKNTTSTAKPMCSVYSGLLNGTSIVYRGCDFVKLNGTVRTTGGLKANGTSAISVTAQFCDKENCNGNAALVPTTTTARPPTPTKHHKNGAPSSHITFTLLFAVAIYSMYKSIC